MATNLKTFTDYDSVADRYIELIDSRCVRSHGVLAADWTRIRMGFRASVFDNPHVSIGGTPKLSFGFCNGNAAGTDVYPAVAAPHCLGFLTNQPTWSVSGSIYPTQHGVAHYALTVNGSTGLWAGADGFASIYMPNYDTTGWTTYIFLEIEKTTKTGDLGTVFTVRHSGNDSSPTYHKNHAEFIAAMEQDNILTIADNEGDLKAGVTADEVTDGEFDSVFISWDQTDATLRIHEVAVSVLEE